MVQDAAGEIDVVDVRKVRIGLAMVAVVMAAALGLMIAIDSTVGRAVMFAVALSAFVRAYLMFRSIRQERRPAV